MSLTVIAATRGSGPAGVQGNSAYGKRARCALRFYFAVLPMGVVLLFGQPGCTPPSESAARAEAGVSPGEAVGWMVRFGAGGKSEQYRQRGWCATAADYTWTDGTSAKFALPVVEPGAVLILHMKLAALVHLPELSAQDVAVYINGQKQADWKVADPADFEVTIPAGMTANTATLNVELLIPRAVSPRSLGMNPDERLLGLRCYFIELKRG